MIGLEFGAEVTEAERNHSDTVLLHYFVVALRYGQIHEQNDIGLRMSAVHEKKKHAL